MLLLIIEIILPLKNILSTFSSYRPTDFCYMCKIIPSCQAVKEKKWNFYLVLEKSLNFIGE